MFEPQWFVWALVIIQGIYVFMLTGCKCDWYFDDQCTGISPLNFNDCLCCSLHNTKAQVFYNKNWILGRRPVIFKYGSKNVYSLVHVLAGSSLKMSSALKVAYFGNWNTFFKIALII